MVPPYIEPAIGQHNQLANPDGRKFVVIITAVNSTTITLNGNHPPAGKQFALIWN